METRLFSNLGCSRSLIEIEVRKYGEVNKAMGTGQIRETKLLAAYD